MLWHKRSDHIFIERIKRLVNDGILKALDFTDFSIYIDYIKGKKNKFKRYTRRTSDILENIHINIFRSL